MDLKLISGYFVNEKLSLRVCESVLMNFFYFDTFTCFEDEFR